MVLDWKHYAEIWCRFWLCMARALYACLGANWWGASVQRLCLQFAPREKVIRQRKHHIDVVLRSEALRAPYSVFVDASHRLRTTLGHTCYSACIRMVLCASKNQIPLLYYVNPLSSKSNSQHPLLNPSSPKMSLSSVASPETVQKGLKWIKSSNSALQCVARGRFELPSPWKERDLNQRFFFCLTKSRI